MQAIDYTLNKNQSYLAAESRILYGLDDDHSLFIILPENIKLKSSPKPLSRIGDLLIQLESIITQRYHPTYYYYVTFITNITVPTGFKNKTPKIGLAAPSGFGSPTFFLGIPIRYVSIDWYFYNAYGAILTTPNAGTKFGNQFLYQAGIGRSLSHNLKHWVFCLTLELNGIYSQKDRLNFVINQNSGGNVIWLGPNIWICNETIISQTGFQFPLTQQLYGKQNKNIFRIASVFAYKFN